MTENLLNVEVPEHVKFALSSLGAEDWRIINAWLMHLRNWWNDDFIRSKAKLIDAAEQIYTLQTSSDLIIAFRIADKTATVLSIFRKETLRAFQAAAGRGTP